MTEETSQTGGLLVSLRNLARTLLAIVQTRLEIVASEIEEQKARLARIAVLAAIAGFCLGLAANLLVFFLVVLFWDTHRLLTIGVLAGVFSVAGITAVVMLRSAIAQRPKLLSVTLAELSKDRQRLGDR
jgi:uncharacterized membrane protein YqjE